MHARSMALVAVALSGLMSLTACSGGSAESTSTPSASAGAGGFSEYRDCLAANGVDLPDGGTRPSAMPTAQPTGEPPTGAAGTPGQPPLPEGIDQETFDAAQAACADLAPQPGAGGPAGAGPDIDASALAAFTTCLGDNGVDVPAGTDPMRQLDRTDAAVQAAWETCAPLLPQPS